MTTFLVMLATAATQLTIGALALKPADFLDGRAIAGGTGSPVVMLTLTPAATVRVEKLAPNSVIQVNGAATTARISGNTIEIDGQPSFDAAKKLALDLSGKPPLPDSIEE